MKTKICKICKEKLKLNSKNFPYHQKSNNTFRPECRACYNKLRRERRKSDENYREKTKNQSKNYYKRNKEKIIKSVFEYRSRPENKEKVYQWGLNYREKAKRKFKEFKSNLKCSKCEENHISCLEFHHVDPSLKEGLITKMIYSPKKLEKELKKCIILCANCHRKLHYNINHKN